MEKTRNRVGAIILKYIFPAKNTIIFRSKILGRTVKKTHTHET